MPIYEYRCDNCQHELEVLKKISDPEPETCPECGKDTLTRVISPVGFRLKGSGWYETDFKDKNRRNVVGSDQKKPAEGKEKADSGKSASETKSDSGSESGKSTKKSEKSSKATTTDQAA